MTDDTGHDQDYVTLSSRIAYQGEIIAVVEEELRLPDGTIVGRESVRHPGAVGVVAITPAGDVVLVEQYRQPVKRKLLEIPAGKLTPDEAPDECAIRELAEETGWQGRSMIPLGVYYTTPGFTDERFHMFLATGLEPGIRAPEGEEELTMRVVETPFATSVADAKEGRIEDGKTLVGLLLAEAYLGRE